MELFCEDFSENLALITSKMPSALEQITLQDFKEGRNRRWGTTNPTKFDIPFWNAMVKRGATPWTARRMFLGGLSEAKQIRQDAEREAEFAKKCESYEIKERLFDSSDDEDAEAANKEEGGKEDVEAAEKREAKTNPRQAKFDALEYLRVEHGADAVGEGLCNDEPDAKFFSNPIWCDTRWFGTETKLADGTLVQIGGEHEDFYNPDFMIYNDVIVFHPSPNRRKRRHDRELDIFGDPEDVFPPTDGHTATYVPTLDAIVIVGNMSAPELDRDLADNGATPVYLLKAGAWKIERMATTGGPGIIWYHVAELQDGRMRVTGKQSEYSYIATERQVLKDGKHEVVGIEYDEAWELNFDTWTWAHHAPEWTTVPKKKRGRGRGRCG